MSSGFVSESEINEARQRRQKEWENVRRPDEPLERPEEPYDGRSLFDRLKEQKVKKDLEYEEAHKLKNLIRGLDDDEVQFLELVDKNKMDIEKNHMMEDECELKDFRSRVATLQEKTAEKKLQNDLNLKVKPQTSNTNARLSQKCLLSIGIKRKKADVRSSVTSRNKFEKLDNRDEKKSIIIAAKDAGNKIINTVTLKDIEDLPSMKTKMLDKGQFRCVAVLPGLGPYNESSDSEISSGSDDDPQDYEDHGKYDLVGRKHQKEKYQDG